MSDLDQDDIDKLLADALGGGADSGDAEEGGPQSQDEIDALFAQIGMGGGESEPAEAESAAPAEQGVASQDEIDALFSAAADEAGGAAPAAAALPSQSPEQDDIDALLAGISDEPPAAGAASAEPVASEAASAAPAEQVEPAAQPETVGNDDIDALLNAALGGAQAEEPAPEPEAEEEPASEPAASGRADQDEIDALFAQSATEAAEADEAGAEAVSASAGAALDEVSSGEEPSEALTEEPVTSPTDVQELEESVFGEEAAPAEATSVAPAEAPHHIEETEALDHAPEIDEAAAGGDDEIDALLSSAGVGLAEAEQSAKRQSSPTEQTRIGLATHLEAEQESASRPAAPEAKPGKPTAPAPAAAAPQTTAKSGAGRAPEAPSEADDVLAHAAPPQPSPGARPLPKVDVDLEGIRESLALIGDAGEVEGIAGQIAGLLGQLSERARRFQHVYLTADQEAKQLRVRLAGESHRVAVLESEMQVLRDKMSEARRRSSELEGEKLAVQESVRSERMALQAQARELESRAQMLSAEVEALKGELETARSDATRADLEARRHRFENERLRSEVDSEKQERARLQRALENREKELQALQAQSAGQASSLFIDELHRLVRRLESELEARTSAAREALRLLEKLDVSDDMVPLQSNLRAALQSAAGLDEDRDDALRSLSRDLEWRGEQPACAAGVKADLVSYETAVGAMDLQRARDLASTLLQERHAHAGQLVQRVYRCPGLRRTEVADHLDALVDLLEVLRQALEREEQEAGHETKDTRKAFVQIFDFLHNLVRLKLISRSTGRAWRFFLDLRGRFSFVTSDRQWAEYRDSVLGG